MDINEILVDVPAWKWVLAVLYTFGLTLLRYYGSKKLALSAIRLSVLATLCFLLLEPLLKSTRSEIEPSTIVLVYDASSSQWIGNDSIPRKEALNSWAHEGETLFRDLDYNVEVWDFSKQLTPREKWECNGSRTNLSSALEDIKNKYTHKNVRGVVITTDGLSNSGRDPEFGTSTLDVPHFFIGTGDTTTIKDIEINQILCNQVTYLNNEFPLEIRMRTNGFEGEKFRLNIKLGDDIIDSKSFKITEPNGFYTHRTSIKASSSGMKRIRASISPLSGEEQKENNYASAYIEVLDSKRKITIAANAPHPDVQALKLSLSKNLHQEIYVIFRNEIVDQTTFGKSDVLILHNIPNTSKPTPKPITKALNTDVPILFVGGPIMDWAHIPTERIGLNMKPGKATQEIKGTVNSEFGLFKEPNGLDADLAYLPPLIRAMGEPKPSSSLNSLIYQRLDNLKTEWPLVAFNKDAIGRRSGVIMGEGIWRWRMESSIKNGDSEIFDELINRSLQYLDSRDDVRRFRITAPKRMEEDNRVKFSAQVYDASLNPTTDSDINLILTKSNGEELDFYFSVDGTSFKLDCGRLSPGEYTWRANTVLDNKVEKLSGAFVVSEVKAELISEAANHDLLKRIALKTGGEFLGEMGIEYNEDLGLSFAEKVDKKIEKRDIIHEFTERLELINFNFTFWLILGGLTLEWVIRRRQGSY